MTNSLIRVARDCDLPVRFGGPKTPKVDAGEFSTELNGVDLASLDAKDLKIFVEENPNLAEEILLMAKRGHLPLLMEKVDSGYASLSPNKAARKFYWEYSVLPTLKSLSQKTEHLQKLVSGTSML